VIVDGVRVGLSPTHISHMLVSLKKLAIGLPTRPTSCLHTLQLRSSLLTLSSCLQAYFLAPATLLREKSIDNS